MPPKAKSHIITATPDGNGTNRVPVHFTMTYQHGSSPSGTTIASATARKRGLSLRTCGDGTAAATAMASASAATVTGARLIDSLIRSHRSYGFHKAWVDEFAVVRQFANLLLGQH